MPSANSAPSSSAGNVDHRHSSSTGTALDASALVLQGLGYAAKASQIPYLSDAAALALDIVDIVQKVRSNKDAFKQLADDACELVYAIVLKKQTAPTREFLDDLRDLVQKLADIERFSRKRLSRGILKRIIKRKSDLDTIQEYRQKLEQSMKAFQIKSSLRNEDNINRILEHLKEMREREERTDAAEEGGTLDKEMAKIHREKEKEKERIGRGKLRTSERGPSTSPGTSRPEASCMQSPPNQGGIPSPEFSPANGTWAITNVGGVLNNNSGNTTTNFTSDSNNDSSIRIYHGAS